MEEITSIISNFLLSFGGAFTGLGLMFGIPIMSYWIPQFRAEVSLEREKTKQLEIQLKMKELESQNTVSNQNEIESR